MAFGDRFELARILICPTVVTNVEHNFSLWEIWFDFGFKQINTWKKQKVDVPTLVGTTNWGSGFPSTSSLANLSFSTFSVFTSSSTSLTTFSSSSTSLADGRLLTVGRLLWLLPPPSVPSPAGAVSWAELRRLRALRAAFKKKQKWKKIDKYNLGERRS